MSPELVCGEHMHVRNRTLEEIQQLLFARRPGFGSHLRVRKRMIDDTNQIAVAELDDALGPQILTSAQPHR